MRTGGKCAKLLAGCITLAACGLADDSRAGDIVFSGACDGSAAMALSPKTFVSAFDERSVLSVYATEGDGRPRSSIDLNSFLGFGTETESDIEGAASTEDGRIYWIGSHGRNKNAKERPERKRFFATRWNGTGLQPIGVAREDSFPGKGL